MLNRKFQLTLLVISAYLLAGCASIPRTSDVIIEDQDVSFERIGNVVDALSNTYGARNVLIVLDIDNTLMTSSVDLGGDIWYQWQRGKLDIKPTDEQKVSCLFEDAIGLLYELGPMRLTDQSLPARLRSWQDRGNTVFALTSRSPKYRAATERELARLDLDLMRNPLAAADEPAPVFREQAEREWSYMQGIMMTTGMNKGEMLTKLIDRVGRRFSAIVFVDDTRRHIDDMFAVFQTVYAPEVRLFHYTKIEHERVRANGVVLTAEQAASMASDWKALTATLNAVFPDRVVPEGCLGF